MAQGASVWEQPLVLSQKVPLMAKTSPGEFIRQVRAEGSKVVWPSRQETVTTAIMVAIMMVLLALFFLGVDSVFGWAVRQLLSLA
jgi:preprotein translocase subunit SecE